MNLIIHTGKAANYSYQLRQLRHDERRLSLKMTPRAESYSLCANEFKDDAMDEKSF